MLLLRLLHVGLLRVPCTILKLLLQRRIMHAFALISRMKLYLAVRTLSTRSSGRGRRRRLVTVPLTLASSRIIHQLTLKIQTNQSGSQKSAAFVDNEWWDMMKE
jgi:hypothetical protein